MNMNRTMKSISGRRQAQALKGAVAAVAVALLGACGGGSDGPTTPGMMPLQGEKEQAALARAKALNADAMSKIVAERAAGQR
jgi:hypothetical protein